MNRAPLLIAVLALLALTVTPTATATTTDTDVCTRLEHWGTLTPNYYRLNHLDSVGAALCGGSSREIIEGDCFTLYGGATVNGPPEAPTAPTQIRVYIFGQSQNPTHGTSGEDNWNDALQMWTWTTAAAFNAGSFEYCATTTADSTGQPTTTPHRFVLRVCSTSGTGGACASGFRNYDLNTDGDGNPGTSNRIGDTVRGILTPKARSEDPLKLTAPAIATTGTPVNVTVHAEFDNRTARTGAATNITVSVIGPGNTTTLSPTNPVETILPGGKLAGYYHFWFTPPTDGAYQIFANHTTTQNENRSAPAAIVTASPAPLTRAHYDAMFTALNATLATLATPSHVTTARDALTAHVDAQTAYLAPLANSTTADARDAINAHTTTQTAPLAQETTAASRSTPADVTTAQTAILAHADSQTAYLAPLANSTTANARDAINAHTTTQTAPLAQETTAASRSTPANVTDAQTAILARLDEQSDSLRGAIATTENALTLTHTHQDTKATLHDTNQTRTTHDNARQFSTLKTSTDTAAARAQLYALATVGFVLLTGYLTRYRNKTTN